MTDRERNRKWCMTLNNYTEEEWTMFCGWYEVSQNPETSYYVVGKEIGEKHKIPHLQGYFEFKNQVSLSTLKKRVPKAHWEIKYKKSTPQQAADYCKKDGKYIEFGTISKQGERTDLKQLTTEILSQKLTVSEVVETNPMMYHIFGRTLERVEELANRRKYRTEMTTCDWLVGDTGAGKSHRAFTGYDPSTTYVHNLEDNGWWDNYTGQERVIINDFKGEIKYGTLLQLIDKWPYTVKRRNRAPMPFVSKHIIITSVLRPEECYHNLHASDGIDQLLRRVTVSEVVRGNTETLTTENADEPLMQV